MSEPASDRILRGQTLSFRADPFSVPPEEAITHHQDGAVLLRDGRIAAVGPAADILADAPPDLPLTHHGRDLIMAGFIDAHVHYPQTGIIASYGTQLLDWLQTYTFPEELRFADPAYAETVADLFLDLALANGITSAGVFCTVHPVSVDRFFAAAEARGLAMVAGKVCMDRHAPDGLCDTPASAHDDSKALIERWHGRGRGRYAITPRFAPTSSPEQLEALGALWAAHPEVAMQTHLSENHDEIAWVADLFPDAPDYLGVYEHFGLVGPGALFGHALHLTDRERAVLAERGAAVAHCPTSNLFIGSGLFDLQGLCGGDAPVPVGLATDVGGGSAFSIFDTMKTAYEVAQLRGVSLHPARAFWLATQGSADAVGLGDEIGNLAPGRDADLVVLDLAATPVLAQRVARAESLVECLFALMILGDDRAVRATYAGGRMVHRR